MSLVRFYENATWLPLTFYNMLMIVFPLLVLAYIFHALCLSPWKHIPGPRLCKLTRLWVAYHDLRLQRNEKIYEWHQKYGPVVLIAPGEVSFSTPTATKEIYGSTLRHPKSSYFDNFKMYGERPIFCTLGWSEHREVRKRTFAFYQPPSIKRPVIEQPLRVRTNRFLHAVSQEIKSTSTLEMFSRCNSFAFDNVTGLIYGPRNASQTMETDCEEKKILDGWKTVELWNNLLYNLPLVHHVLRTILAYWNKDPDFLSAEERLHDWNSAKVAKAVEEYQIVADTEDSLLRRLQTTKAQVGEPISSTWIAAEVLDNIHAAQITVALALTFNLWNLATHPEWQRAVREEIRQLPLEEDGLPNNANLEAAKVLGACIRETYRVNPLSSGRAERVVPVAKEYEGVLLQPGTIVSSCTLALHRSPIVFTDPLTYNPGRWLEADLPQLRAMEACHIPFGYGARVCLGKAFANAEIRLLVTSVLLHFEIGQDTASGTSKASMVQLGTHNALPKGMRCDIAFRKLKE